MVLFSSPKLSIALDQRTLFLHPHPAALSIPAEDQVVKGIITLSLPKPKAFNKIVAKFEGKTKLPSLGGFGEEDVEVVKSELEVDLSKMGTLSAGEHQYEYSFILPANAPEYQRSASGYTRYFVSATCEGVGAFSSNLSTPLCEVFPVGNPAARGEVPGNFDTLITNYHEELGPISITLSSPHLTVSGLLFYDITFSSPPPGLKITSLSAYVSQQFILSYSKGPYLPTEQIHTLFTASSNSSECHNPTYDFSTKSKPIKDPKLPCTINLLDTPDLTPIGQNGEEWTYRKLARLPHDDILRPTTLEDTDARIRVVHKLGLNVNFMGRDADGVEREKQLTLSKPAHLISCCALLDDITLPSYSRCSDAVSLQPGVQPTLRDPLGSPFRQAKAGDCTCAQSIDQLVKENDKRMGFDESDASGMRVISEEERLRKTPAVAASY